MNGSCNTSSLARFSVRFLNRRSISSWAPKHIKVTVVLVSGSRCRLKKKPERSQLKSAWLSSLAFCLIFFYGVSSLVASPSKFLSHGTFVSCKPCFRMKQYAPSNFPTWYGMLTGFLILGCQFLSFSTLMFLQREWNQEPFHKWACFWRELVTPS